MDRTIEQESEPEPKPANGRRIAVIGAGVAGTTCARALRRGGHDVVIFEKSRGHGGRCATRRAEPSLRFARC